MYCITVAISLFCVLFATLMYIVYSFALEGFIMVIFQEVFQFQLLLRWFPVGKDSVVLYGLLRRALPVVWLMALLMAYSRHIDTLY